LCVIQNKQTIQPPSNRVVLAGGCKATASGTETVGDYDRPASALVELDRQTRELGGVMMSKRVGWHASMDRPFDAPPGDSVRAGVQQDCRGRQRLSEECDQVPKGVEGRPGEDCGIDASQPRKTLGQLARHHWFAEECWHAGRQPSPRPQVRACVP
jgi:hypothetical protein